MLFIIYFKGILVDRPFFRQNGLIGAYQSSHAASVYTTNRAWNFCGDLSNWVVSSVTRMDHMFDGAVVFNGNLNEWEVDTNRIIW